MKAAVICPFCLSAKIRILSNGVGIMERITEYLCDACHQTWAEVDRHAKPSLMSPGGKRHAS
jgi:transposase-like protein